MGCCKNNVTPPSLIIVAISLVACMSGCSHQKLTGNESTSKSNTNIPEKGMINPFKAPDTPKAVLQNIKYSLDQDLFLRRDFYATENFKWFLGKYNTKQRGEITPYYLGFIFKTEDSSSYVSCISGGVMGWSKVKMASGNIITGGGIAGKIKNFNKQGGLKLPPFCEQFSAETMVAVFGDPVKIIDKMHKPNTPPPPHGMPPETGWGERTHPLGHSEVIYDLSDGVKITRTARFLINGGGLIIFFHIMNNVQE